MQKILGLSGPWVVRVMTAELITVMTIGTESDCEHPDADLARKFVSDLRDNALKREEEKEEKERALVEKKFEKFRLSRLLPKISREMLVSVLNPEDPGMFKWEVVMNQHRYVIATMDSMDGGQRCCASVQQWDPDKLEIGAVSCWKEVDYAYPLSFDEALAYLNEHVKP